MINSIHKRRTQYPEASNASFLTLPDYLAIARACIGKYVTHADLRNKMLKNEDAISFVAHELMMADWKYDGCGTRKGWRSKCAKWSICRFLAKSKNSKNRKLASLDNAFEDANAAEVVEDSRTYYDSPERNEDREQALQLLDNKFLTKKQRKYMEMHYIQNMSIAEIAEQTSISRQGVQQVINHGLKNIRKMVHTNG